MEGIRFSILFGSNADLDLLSLGKILSHLSTMLAEINSEVAPEYPIRMVLNSISTANTFTIALKSQKPADLFSELNLEDTALESSVLNAFIEILRKLKAIHGPNIDNVSLNRFEYKMLLNNRRFKNAMKSLLRTLKDDENIFEFVLTDENSKEICALSKEQFTMMQSFDILPKRIQKRSGHIHLIKLAFEKHLTWDFIYRGEKRTSYIVDSNFWKAVKHGEITFAPGTELRVEIEVEQVFNSEYGIFCDTDNLVIVKVLDIIKHHPQPELYADLIPERRSRKLSMFLTGKRAHDPDT